MSKKFPDPDRPYRTSLDNLKTVRPLGGVYCNRNRLGEILNELLLIYDATEKEKELIDIQKLAEKLAGKWDKDKTDKTPWSERYAMSIVWVLNAFLNCDAYLRTILKKSGLKGCSQLWPVAAKTAVFCQKHKNFKQV